MYILECEDSVDGIFSGIYYAWESKLGHDNIRIRLRNEGNLELFSEYILIDTDTVKANKVSGTLMKRFGMEAYSQIFNAALSDGENKAEAIYRTVILGLSMENEREIMNYLSNDWVCNVFQLSRNVGNEAHHLTGFIRFQELSNGILFSKINPKNNVLILLAPHFTDRLPLENWMIYDEKRGSALLHQKSCAPVIVFNESIDMDAIQNISDKEKEYQELWKCFCETISIKERENKKLQMTNVPKRFWSNMSELNEKLS